MSNDVEIELNNEEDAAQIMIKEEINKMKKEWSPEQEKGKILEVENEIFENIMRDYAIEVNAIKRMLKRRKKRSQNLRMKIRHVKMKWRKKCRN